MGVGIAAHLAGAGIKTYLLDIVPPDLKGQGESRAAQPLCFKRHRARLKGQTAIFYDPSAALQITSGNLEDHLDWLKDCDLVIEAVTEKLEIKQSLFTKIASHLGPTTLLASNTSGLSVAQMAEKLPSELQKRFLVMHFFNPVRYMRLLELVPGPKTEPSTMARAARIGEFLGKGVVYGKDTPNFVGNRIGIYSIMRSVRTMEAMELSIEAVDKIAGQPMGRPAVPPFAPPTLSGSILSCTSPTTATHR